MFNLGNVIKFEIVRTLKKPFFWISALATPLLMIGMIGVSMLSSAQMTESLLDGVEMEGMNVAVMDESGMLDETVLAEIGATIVTDAEEMIEKVRTGEVNVFYHVPENLAEDVIRIYTHTESRGLFDDFSVKIRGLLAAAALEDVGENQAAILSGTVGWETMAFIDGEEDNLIGRAVIPAIAAIIFFLLISSFGSQAIASTTEEKENRVTEMILTTTSSRSLIIGKIVALIVLAILQLTIMLSPMIAGYMNAERISMGEEAYLSDMLGSIDIVVNAQTVGMSLALLVFGYLFYIAVLVAVSAMTPTAKEANSFFGVAMMLMFAPMFVIGSIMASTPDLITRVLSFFPLTSPLTLLMRNAFGNLNFIDGMIGLGILVISAILAMWLAIWLFQKGAIEFSSKINLKAMLARKNWK
ncbi:ABC transporter permease [Candidatus Saccharibacteria bacterium]|nr:ABC transporter permease [Candidatus Saccharibacteria bacterium]